MVQYKMLEEERQRYVTSDWLFRPDKQFRAEFARMQIPASVGPMIDYRLNSSPFFFKFVKRKLISSPKEPLNKRLQVGLRVNCMGLGGDGPSDGALRGLFQGKIGLGEGIEPPSALILGAFVERSRRQVLLGRYQVGEPQQHHQPLGVLGQPR